MLKGCQREMVVLKGDSDSVFESAYFLLKKSPDKEKVSKEDIIACANSIVEENCFSSIRKRRLKTALLCIACFLLGVACTVPLLLFVR